MTAHPNCCLLMMVVIHEVFPMGEHGHLRIRAVYFEGGSALLGCLRPSF